MNEEIQNNISNPQETIAFLRAKWRTRRRITIATCVLYALICIAFVFYIPESRIVALDSFFGAFSLAAGTVVGAYFGFTTWADKGK